MTEHKHERVTRLLREELGPPGSTLPSEAEIASRYGVGRGTARRALETLESEGLISSSQGSLRTVRGLRRWHWPMSRWEKAHTPEADAWANTVRKQGGDPQTEVQVLIVSASDEIARALNVPAGEPVLTRSRIRSVNGEPHQLSDSYFPKWVTDDAPIFAEPGDTSSSEGLLAASGHRQARFRDEVSSRMPTSEELNALRIAKGTPLLVHTRIGYDDRNRPVRYMVTRMAADRVIITYDLEND